MTKSKSLSELDFMEHRRFTKNEISVRVMYEHIVFFFYLSEVCVLLTLSKKDMPHASQITEPIPVGTNTLGL